jgi:hypothetical protein
MCPLTNYAVITADLGIRIIANLVRNASKIPVQVTASTLTVLLTSLIFGAMPWSVQCHVEELS